MTLQEFLMVTTLTDSDTHTEYEHEHEHEHEQDKKTKDRASRMVEMHTSIVEAAWKTFNAELAKIVPNDSEASSKIETVYKNSVDAAMKTIQLGLLAEMISH